MSGYRSSESIHHDRTDGTDAGKATQDPWQAISSSIAIEQKKAAIAGAGIDAAPAPLDHLDLGRDIYTGTNGMRGATEKISLADSETAADTKTAVSENSKTETLQVTGGNRAGTANVMLPDNYDPNKKYPLVVALHNYNGSAEDFAGMIDAERLRKQGNIVVLPQANDNAWQGSGLSYFRTPYGDNGQPVNDVDFVKSTIAAVQAKYSTDKKDVVIAAFSQGVALAYDVAKEMDKQQPGAIRAIVAAAGTMPEMDPLPGTSVVQYEPGHNAMQRIGNFLTWEPTVSSFLPELLTKKDCSITGAKQQNGVDSVSFACAGGTHVKALFEQEGEHAWPGQPESHDMWIFGRGSLSKVRLTDYVSAEVAAGQAH